METAIDYKPDPFPVHPRRKSIVRVRPVSQVLLAIKSQNAREAHHNIQCEVLKWMDEHSSVVLPDEALAGNSFELEGVRVQRTAAIAFHNKHRYWAGFQDDDDRAVPRRTWSTEVGLALKDEQTVMLGSRLVCATRGEDPPFDRSIPRFIRNIVRKHRVCFDGGVLLNPRPTVVENEDDVFELIKLLLRKERKCPVLVFSLLDDEKNLLRTAASPQEVHNKTLGAAHIRILTGPASVELRRQLGKDFAVYNQAIRTYQPNFLLQDDEPSRHPVALPERIYDWKERWGVSFETFISNQVLERTVSTPGYEERLPSFTKVKRVYAELQRKQARQADASDEVLLELAEAEINALQDHLKEQEELYDGLLALAEQEKEQAVNESAEAKSRSYALRRRIDYLQSSQKSLEKTGHLEIPDNLENFKEWCELHLAGSVIMNSRAYRGLKKSEYEDIALIYKSLLLLRDFYVPMHRSGSMECKTQFETRCHEYGLREGASLSNGNTGKEDTYFIYHEGKKRLLDRHLKKGVSREPRNCFRLYFFWDGENEQVVVGWLPSHLRTGAS